MLNTVLVIASTCFAFLCPEVIYRAKKIIEGEPSRQLNYRLASSVYGQFDPRFGQRFLPDSSLNYAVVRGGVVEQCLGVIASANSDGLGGRATFADYSTADLRLITTGDSFSHWKQDGLTIPDVVETLISRSANRKTANLNLARGAYGLLHMLVISSEFARELRPHAIVIQFVSDDLVRGWWYTSQSEMEGRLRALISPRADSFGDFRLTNDEYIVDRLATDEWCERQRNQGHQDKVLRDANEFYREYVRAKNIGVNPFAIDRLYFYDRLYYQIAGLRWFQDHNVIPQVSHREFVTSAVYKRSIALIREMQIPVILVHVPLAAEIRRGRPALGTEARKIWKQLEHDLGTKVLTYFDLPGRPAPPEKIDLTPWDGHPNAAGIRFYGEYVHSALKQNHAALFGLPASASN